MKYPLKSRLNYTPFPYKNNLFFNEILRDDCGLFLKKYFEWKDEKIENTRKWHEPTFVNFRSPKSFPQHFFFLESSFNIYSKPCVKLAPASTLQELIIEFSG